MKRTKMIKKTTAQRVYAPNAPSYMFFTPWLTSIFENMSS